MEEEEFFFRGDQLPTNEDVLAYINSRTRYGKMSQSLAMNEMASEVHGIWQKADTRTTPSRTTPLQHVAKSF